MFKTLTATFDGQALWPETPLNLELNIRYLVTIEPFAASNGEEEGDVWDLLETVAGTVDAPSDWAAEHDHYLYGTPKRHIETVI